MDAYKRLCLLHGTCSLLHRPTDTAYKHQQPYSTRSKPRTMLTALLLALAAAAPALADNHIKMKGNDFNLCIDNSNGSQNNGNPLQV